MTTPSIPEPPPSDVNLRELIEHLSRTLAAKSSDVTVSLDAIEACLKALEGSGYEIRSRKNQCLAPPPATALPTELDLNAQGKGLRPLVDLLRRASRDDQAGSPLLYAQVAEQMVKAGEYLIAYDILKKGLKHWPVDLRLRQQQALALARSGATSSAQAILTKLVQEGHTDAETLSLLARTNKDLWQAELDPLRARHWLQESQRLYQQGYDNAVAKQSADGIVYAGINAATTALLLGEVTTAKQVAEHVATVCRTQLAAGPDYWAQATLGECAVIRGELAEAEDHYRAAVELAGSNHANLVTTKRNATFLLSHLGADVEQLSEWFPIPTVVVFTGHMIDRPGMPQRFTPQQIAAVQWKIEKVLAEVDAGFGIAGAACGGDLLFLEALKQRNAKYQIVLPLARKEFLSTSVAWGTGRNWVSDFRRAFRSRPKVTIVNEYSQSAQSLHFEHANHVMTGLALLKGISLCTRVVPLAVWDEGPARGPGGAGTLVEFWRKLGLEPRIINPLKLPPSVIEVPKTSTTEPIVPPAPAESPYAFPVEVRAMLFADVVGYSKLKEEEIPLFVNVFMGSIANCVKASGIAVETCNTWGDAIYFVLRTVQDAGNIALLITEYVQSIQWEEKGFRAPLSLRTGLHVGPVYRFMDPVTQTINHSGAHVSRAARIEPIAPPGEVYASEAFAAVAAAEKVVGFRCDYVGVTPMAKKYGDFPTYHVRRVSTHDTPPISNQEHK